MTTLEHADAVRSRPWTLVYALAVVAVLYFARAILIPLSLAVLLAFLLAPLVLRLQRTLRSRLLSVGVVTVLAIAVVAGVTLLVGQQFMGFMEQLPTYRDTIVHKVRAVRSGTGGVVGQAAETIRAIGDELREGPPGGSHSDIARAPVATGDGARDGDGLSLLSTVARPLLEPLASAAVVLLLLVLMLVSRESIRDRVIRLAGLNNIGITTRALDDAGRRVGKYLGAHLLINAIYGVGIAAGLAMVGVPNAAVCGLIAGLLRFVPMLGAWLGAVVPVALAIAVFDDWTHVAAVIALFAFLEAANNLALEPWLYGSNTGLSSLGVVLAIVFWTWIWGPIGLVLAVPVTVCLVVFSKQIPQLAALGIVLGDEPPLTDPMRFYQRLLSNDHEEAMLILSRAGTPDDPVKVLDDVVIPALGAARGDLSRGLLTRPQAQRIAQAARELSWEWIEDLLPPDQEATLDVPPVLCVPAADELDEATGALLVQLLERRGIPAFASSSEALLNESLAAAQSRGSRVLVLSSIEPADSGHVRRVCKTILRRAPDARLVLGAWGESPAGGGEDPPVGEVDARVSTLAQALVTIQALASAASARVASPR
jgi:predicted PurR-regulated permease PerM